MSDLTAENNYQFPVTPAPAVLGRDDWNAVMASVSGRLVALEDKRSELQDLINDLSFSGQQRLDAAIEPIIEDIERRLAELGDEVLAMKHTNAQIINDFNDVVAVNLQDLADAIQNAQDGLADIEAQFDVILSGGVPADRVIGNFDGGTY